MGYFRFSVQRLVEKKRFLEEKLKKETRKEQIKQIESKIIELDKKIEPNIFWRSDMGTYEKAKKAEKAEKVKEVIYGIKVSKGINQTLIWKVLKKVCELKNEEGTKIAKELKEKYPEAFSGAVRCLVSKKRINYINSIC